MTEQPADTPLVAKDSDSSCVSCEDEVEGLQRLPCLHSVSVCEKQECRKELVNNKVFCSECKEVFDVPEIGLPSYSFATNCSYHGRSLELYCEECKVLICQLCEADGIHKSHAVSPVSEKLVMTKSTLNACISEVNSKMETLDARMKEIDEKQVTLDHHFTDAKEEVNRMIEELIAQLRTRRNALISELEQKNMVGINNLKKYKGEVQSHHSKLAAYKTKVEKVVKSASRIELISMSQIAVERLKLLIETTSHPILPLPSIHFVNSRNKQQAKDSVEVLGSIESVSPPNCSMSGVAVSDNVIRYAPWSVPFSFKVFTRDHSGNQWVFGGENVSAVLTPTTCEVPVSYGHVVDNRDGTYQVEFKCVPSNQSELVVTVNGERIKSSPVKVEIGYPMGIKQIIKDPRKKNRRFRALSFTKSGLLLATDDENKNICILNENGEFVRTFKVNSGGDHMYGITELSDGNIAVSLSDKNRIAVYTPKGERVRDFGSDKLKMPCGIAVNNEGQLFVAESNGNRLSVYSEDGRFQSRFGSKGSQPGKFHNPEQICIAQDGLVYVTDRYNHRIQVFKQDGSFVHQFGNDLLNAPTGLTITKDDHVVVVTSYQWWRNNKLIIFAKSKKCVLESSDLGLYYPYGVAVSERGIIYIADPDNNRIVKV